MPKLDLGKVVPQKGTDYFTQQDINDIVNTTMTDLQPELDKKADIEDIPDVSGFITKDVNNLTNYYDKTTVDSKVSSVYKYKGSVATYDQLPSAGLTVGDVYNVEDTGDNYAWTGTTWDKLGGNIDVSNLQTKITSTNKLDSDLVDDTSSTNKFVSTAEKATWNGKQNPLTAGNNITISNDIISAKDKVINIDLYKSASTPLILEDLEVGAYMLKSSNMNSSETFYLKARATDTTTHSVGLSDFSHYFPFYKLNEFETGKYAYAFMSTSEMAFEIRKYDENSTSGIGSSGIQDIYKFFRTARNVYNSVASNNDYSGANNYTTLPTSSVAPTSNNQFANKKYVDDAVASAGGGEMPYYCMEDFPNNFAIERGSASRISTIVNPFGLKKGIYYTRNYDIARYPNTLAPGSSFQSSVGFTTATGTGASLNWDGILYIFEDMPDTASEYVQEDTTYPKYFASYETDKRQRIYLYYNTGATSITMKYGSWEAVSLAGTNVQNTSINFGNAYLNSSHTPTADTHLANKKYVDDAIAAAIANLGN